MTVAWTFLCLEIETEGDFIIPRYDNELLARQMAKEEAQRTGRSVMLCKVVAVELHKRSNENAG